MSPTDRSETGAPKGDASPSVLANLPRTRPQRASARRSAARSANGGPPAASKPAKPAASSKKAAPAPRSATSTASSPAAKQKQKRAPAASKRARPAAAKARRPAPRKARAPQAVSEPVPRQGFESEGANASGSVAPPGGAELLATAAEIVGEVARASVSTGERLLRDAFSRLRP